MTTSHRCHVHRLWDGESYLDLPEGVRVPAEYRFQQGLRRDHAEALDDRPDLARLLHDMALWGVAADDLDAAIDALLAG